MTVASIDTNVLVRYIVQDDMVQFALAAELIESCRVAGTQAVVPLLVILEAEWVFRTAYGYSKPAIAEIFSILLYSGDVQIDDAYVLQRALLLWNMRSVNFANCLILAKSLELGAAMYTFDKRAAKLPGAVLLKS
ncbi:PIN domain-containing protein [Oxalobacteraceae bacterium A2-2]